MPRSNAASLCARLENKSACSFMQRVWWSGCTNGRQQPLSRVWELGQAHGLQQSKGPWNLYFERSWDRLVGE